MTTRMCRKGLHPLEGDNLMPIPGRDVSRCRACKVEADKRPHNFVARWPITDPTLPESDLIAEAEYDIPNVRPDGMALRWKRWRIEGDELVLEARAVSSPGSQKKDRCKRDHPFTDENTVWKRKGEKLWRTCRACQKITADKRRPVSETLPIEPLVTYLKARHMDGLANRVTRSDMAQDGRIYLATADQFAVKELKTHPALIWGDEWWDREAMEAA